MKNQSGIAQVYFLFIILAGIAISVFLVQYTQVFKPKAYSDEDLAAYCEEINQNNVPKPTAGAGLIRIPASALDGRFQIIDDSVVDTQSGASFFYLDSTDGTIRIRRDSDNSNDNEENNQFIEVYIDNP